MPAVFDFEHVVRSDEIDALGHANNLAYLKWMVDAAVAHSTAQGWPPSRHLELGAGWVVRSHAIEYLRPAFAGEQIIVRTWVADFRKITSLRKYRVIRVSDDALLAEAQTNWVFIDYHRGIPRRIPLEIQNAFVVVRQQTGELDEP
jgi:acyl-CoA thioester hydrolase